MAYRLDGLRAYLTNGSTRTYYLYDMGEPVVEMNGSGQITGVNVFAADGLVARKQSGSWIYYNFDQQGNVAQRTSSTGAVLSSSTYDSYGVESTTGSPSDPFGYNARWGYYLDRSTGLYLYQHRYYDPGQGRWLNRDPVGYAGGDDVYAYCFDQAGGREDRIGYFGIPIFGPIAAAFASCILAGGLRAVIDWLEGSSCSSVCHAATDCIGAIFGFIAGVVSAGLGPILSGCIGGLASEAGSLVGDELCSLSSGSCPPPDMSPRCVVMDLVGGLLGGCAGGAIGCRKGDLWKLVGSVLATLDGDAFGDLGGDICASTGG